MSDLTTEVEAIIRNVPDFPKPGIQFKDITPLLSDSELLAKVIAHFHDHYASKKIDVIVGVESRGFLFGIPLALSLGVPFVPARKKGKLPADKIEYSYDLEYGSATLEMHRDAITAGQRVVIIDDLLATGGTANATGQLVQQLGGEVASFAFVIELGFLNGRQAIGDCDVLSLINYS